jgi:hypothetical protein
MKTGRRNVKSGADSEAKPLTCLVSSALKRQLMAKLASEGAKYSEWLRPLIEAKVAGREIRIDGRVHEL